MPFQQVWQYLCGANSMMKKQLSIWSVLLILGLTSCQTKQEYITKEQLLKRSDSLTAIRFEELQQQAAEDLDHRIAIEVKPKVDSILEGATGITPVVNEEAPAMDIHPEIPVLHRLRDTAKKDSLK